MTQWKRKPLLTREELRAAICNATDKIGYCTAVAEDDETIVKGSAAWMLKEALEDTSSFLARLSWNIYVRGLEAAEPGELPRG
jgi:hypothetical protein